MHPLGKLQVERRRELGEVVMLNQDSEAAMCIPLALLGLAQSSWLRFRSSLE